MEKTPNNTNYFRDDLEFKALTRALSYSESGFYLLKISNSTHTSEVEDSLKYAITDLTNEEVVIAERYIVEPSDDYGADTVESILMPFKEWISHLRNYSSLPEVKRNIFLVDGTKIHESNIIQLADHFACMNGPRDYIAGNPAGATLVLMSDNINIEPHIRNYQDLMTCCSGRFSIK